MINLLPPQLKNDYAYARRNTTLRRYILRFGVGLIGIALISVGGVMYLQQETNRYIATANQAEQTLEQKEQAQIAKQAKEISGSLKLAVQVLSNEVLFSKLLRQLAVVTPSNVSLSTFNISQLQDSVDITANTTDYAAATQLQINLQDPANQIFAKADIVSINCTSGATGTASRYPCTVVVRALFDKNNPFLFINDKQAAAKP